MSEFQVAVERIRAGSQAPAPIEPASEEITIDSKFDAGNGDVVRIEGNEVDIRIKDDIYTVSEKKTHKQWFYFRASGVQGKMCTFNLINAGDCSFPHAFKNYHVCTSYDRKAWFRTESSYDENKGVLTWEVLPTMNQVYFAYFWPYSIERCHDLVAKCTASITPKCNVRCLGNTLDGRPLDIITLGSGPRKVWAIGRQHPGESQASWWMDGFINRLLDNSDAICRHLLLEATIYIIPNMNPDGSFRGHLRTNACGANLNREWCSKEGYEAPTLERSPEVYYALREMDRIGVDFFVDVHGDEELPYNFLAGSEGCPVWGERLKNLQEEFGKAYESVNPDFQTEHGYEIDRPFQANMSVCSNQIAQRFNCLAFTFEMPYKDTTAVPDAEFGWTGLRSMKMGSSMLTAISQMVRKLRPEEEGSAAGTA